MSFEEDLVKEINVLRTNPKGYIQKMKKYISYFDGNLLKLPGSEASIETQEGVAAYNDAINFLSKQKPVEPLQPSKGLARIAKDFVSEIQKINPDEIGNIDLDKIIEKYGKFTGDLARAMDLGGETPEQVLVNLMASDGDPSREQRDSLLNNNLKKVGIGFGKHEDFKYVTVIVSCTKFVNNKDSNDSGYFSRSKYNNPSDPSRKVISENRTEKEIIENGKKKKLVKITKTFADGTKETETVVEKEED
jgi:hypothetical protein